MHYVHAVTSLLLVRTCCARHPVGTVAEVTWVERASGGSGRRRVAELVEEANHLVHVR